MTAFDRWHDIEEQTEDAATGGRKGVKLTQIGALDPLALIVLGRVAGMGANKYAAFNYLKGFDYSKAYNAMMRHASLWWAGEDNDAESGLPHIAHAAWMALALISFAERGIGNDDRPPRPFGEATALPLWARAMGLSPEQAAERIDRFGTERLTTCMRMGDDLSVCGLPAVAHVHQPFSAPHEGHNHADATDHKHHVFNPTGA